MTLAPPQLAPQIVVRRAVADDRTALIDFYREHHPERARLTNATLWDWQFLRQPGRGAEVPFFVLEANGKIVGGIGYVATRLQVGKTVTEAIVPINYFVASAFRGLPALRLWRAVLAERPLVIGACLSQDTLRLLRKSKFVDLGGHLLAYHYGLGFEAQTMASSFIAITRKLLESGRRKILRVAHPRTRYLVSEQLDADFVALCQENSAKCCFRNNAEWHQWRYANSPSLQLLYIYQYRHGKPAAMAIVHHDKANRQLVILDIMWRDAWLASLSGLVGKIISRARRLHCRSVVTHALSPTLDRVLRRCLFTATTSSLGMMVFSRDEQQYEILTDHRNWHFMLGNTDAY